MNIMEKMARAIFEHWQFQGRMAGTMAGDNPTKWIEGGNSFKQEEARDYSRAALTATGLPEQQLEGLAAGTMVVVPQDALDWLFGLGEDFEPKAGQTGKFWWRTEFRRRAMLVAKEGGMKTVLALRADILMWRKVRLTSDLNFIKPSLCKLFIHGGCYGCPVFTATHAPLCLNTPVGKTKLAELLFDPTPHADRQIHFLETLLPKES